MIIIMMFIMIIGLTHLSHADQPKTATEATFCPTVPGSASILLHCGAAELLSGAARLPSCSVELLCEKNSKKLHSEKIWPAAQLLRLISYIP